MNGDIDDVEVVICILTPQFDHYTILYEDTNFAKIFHCSPNINLKMHLVNPHSPYIFHVPLVPSDIWAVLKTSSGILLDNDSHGRIESINNDGYQRLWNIYDSNDIGTTTENYIIDITWEAVSYEIAIKLIFDWDVPTSLNVHAIDQTNNKIIIDTNSILQLNVQPDNWHECKYTHIGTGFDPLVLMYAFDIGSHSRVHIDFGSNNSILQNIEDGIQFYHFEFHSYHFYIKSSISWTNCPQISSLSLNYSFSTEPHKKYTLHLTSGFDKYSFSYIAHAINYHPAGCIIHMNDIQYSYLSTSIDTSNCIIAQNCYLFSLQISAYAYHNSIIGYNINSEITNIGKHILDIEDTYNQSLSYQWVTYQRDDDWTHFKLLIEWYTGKRASERLWLRELKLFIFEYANIENGDDLIVDDVNSSIYMNASKVRIPTTDTHGLLNNKIGSEYRVSIEEKNTVLYFGFNNPSTDGLITPQRGILLEFEIHKDVFHNYLDGYNSQNITNGEVSFMSILKHPERYDDSTSIPWELLEYGKTINARKTAQIESNLWKPILNKIIDYSNSNTYTITIPRERPKPMLSSLSLQYKFTTDTDYSILSLTQPFYSNCFSYTTNHISYKPGECHILINSLIFSNSSGVSNAFSSIHIINENCYSFNLDIDVHPLYETIEQIIDTTIETIDKSTVLTQWVVSENENWTNFKLYFEWYPIENSLWLSTLIIGTFGEHLLVGDYSNKFRFAGTNGLINNRIGDANAKYTLITAHLPEVLHFELNSQSTLGLITPQRGILLEFEINNNEFDNNFNVSTLLYELESITRFYILEENDKDYPGIFDALILRETNAEFDNTIERRSWKTIVNRIVDHSYYNTYTITIPRSSPIGFSSISFSYKVDNLYHKIFLKESIEYSTQFYTTIPKYIPHHVTSLELSSISTSETYDSVLNSDDNCYLFIITLNSGHISKSYNIEIQRISDPKLTFFELGYSFNSKFINDGSFIPSIDVLTLTQPFNTNSFEYTANCIGYQPGECHVYINSIAFADRSITSDTFSSIRIISEHSYSFDFEIDVYAYHENCTEQIINSIYPVTIDGLDSDTINYQWVTSSNGIWTNFKLLIEWPHHNHHNNHRWIKNLTLTHFDGANIRHANIIIDSFDSHAYNYTVTNQLRIPTTNTFGILNKGLENNNYTETRHYENDFLEVIEFRYNTTDFLQLISPQGQRHILLEFEVRNTEFIDDTFTIGHITGTKGELHYFHSIDESWSEVSMNLSNSIIDNLWKTVPKRVILPAYFNTYTITIPREQHNILIDSLILEYSFVTSYSSYNIEFPHVFSSNSFFYISSPIDYELGDCIIGINSYTTYPSDLTVSIGSNYIINENCYSFKVETNVYETYYDVSGNRQVNYDKSNTYTITILRNRLTPRLDSLIINNNAITFTPEFNSITYKYTTTLVNYEIEFLDIDLIYNYPSKVTHTSQLNSYRNEHGSIENSIIINIFEINNINNSQQYIISYTRNAIITRIHNISNMSIAFRSNCFSYDLDELDIVVTPIPYENTINVLDHYIWYRYHKMRIPELNHNITVTSHKNDDKTILNSITINIYENANPNNSTDYVITYTRSAPSSDNSLTNIIIFRNGNAMDMIPLFNYNESIYDIDVEFEYTKFNTNNIHIGKPPHSIVEYNYNGFDINDTIADLFSGTNSIYINVRAQNGDVRTYTIRINRSTNVFDSWYFRSYHSELSFYCNHWSDMLPATSSLSTIIDFKSTHDLNINEIVIGTTQSATILHDTIVFNSTNPYIYSTKIKELIVKDVHHNCLIIEQYGRHSYRTECNYSDVILDIDIITENTDVENVITGPIFLNCGQNSYNISIYNQFDIEHYILYINRLSPPIIVEIDNILIYDMNDNDIFYGTFRGQHNNINYHIARTFGPTEYFVNIKIKLKNNILLPGESVLINDLEFHCIDYQSINISITNSVFVITTISQNGIYHSYHFHTKHYTPIEYSNTVPLPPRVSLSEHGFYCAIYRGYKEPYYTYNINYAWVTHDEGYFGISKFELRWLDIRDKELIMPPYAFGDYHRPIINRRLRSNSFIIQKNWQTIASNHYGLSTHYNYGISPPDSIDEWTIVRSTQTTYPIFHAIADHIMPKPEMDWTPLLEYWSETDHTVTESVLTHWQTTMLFYTMNISTTPITDYILYKATHQAFNHVDVRQFYPNLYMNETNTNMNYPYRDDNFLKLSSLQITDYPIQFDENCYQYVLTSVRYFTNSLNISYTTNCSNNLIVIYGNNDFIIGENTILINLSLWLDDKLSASVSYIININVPPDPNDISTLGSFSIDDYDISFNSEQHIYYTYLEYHHTREITFHYSLEDKYSKAFLYLNENSIHSNVILLPSGRNNNLLIQVIADNGYTKTDYMFYLIHEAGSINNHYDQIFLEYNVNFNGTSLVSPTTYFKTHWVVQRRYGEFDNYKLYYEWNPINFDDGIYSVQLYGLSNLGITEFSVSSHDSIEYLYQNQLRIPTTNTYGVINKTLLNNIDFNLSNNHFKFKYQTSPYLKTKSGLLIEFEIHKSISNSNVITNVTGSENNTDGMILIETRHDSESVSQQYKMYTNFYRDNYTYQSIIADNTLQPVHWYIPIDKYVKLLYNDTRNGFNLVVIPENRYSQVTIDSNSTQTLHFTSSSLNIGDNDITINIISQAGVVNSFDITLDQLDKSSNANLKSLIWTGSSLIPPFQSNIYTYQVNQDYYGDTIIKTANSFAAFTIDGINSQQIGTPNSVIINVLAENGTDSNSYIINIDFNSSRSFNSPLGHNGIYTTTYIWEDYTTSGLFHHAVYYYNSYPGFKDNVYKIYEFSLGFIPQNIDSRIAKFDSAHDIFPIFEAGLYAIFEEKYLTDTNRYRTKLSFCFIHNADFRVRRIQIKLVDYTYNDGSEIYFVQNPDATISDPIRSNILQINDSYENANNGKGSTIVPYSMHPGFEYRPVWKQDTGSSDWHIMCQTYTLFLYQQWWNSMIQPNKPPEFLIEIETPRPLNFSKLEYFLGKEYQLPERVFPFTYNGITYTDHTVPQYHVKYQGSYDQDSGFFNYYSQNHYNSFMINAIFTSIRERQYVNRVNTFHNWYMYDNKSYANINWDTMLGSESNILFIQYSNSYIQSFSSVEFHITEITGNSSVMYSSNCIIFRNPYNNDTRLYSIGNDLISFHPNCYIYNYSALNSINSILFDVKLYGVNAKSNIDPNCYFNLSPGSNSLNITITAFNGQSSTYTFNIFSEIISQDSALKNIDIENIDFEFNSHEYSYSKETFYSTFTINSIITNNKYASYSIYLNETDITASTQGSFNLQVGLNKFIVHIVAQDSNCNNSYIFYINYIDVNTFISVYNTLNYSSESFYFSIYEYKDSSDNINTFIFYKSNLHENYTRVNKLKLYMDYDGVINFIPCDIDLLNLLSERRYHTMHYKYRWDLNLDQQYNSTRMDHIQSKIVRGEDRYYNYPNVFKWLLLRMNHNQLEFIQYDWNKMILPDDSWRVFAHITSQYSLNITAFQYTKAIQSGSVHHTDEEDTTLYQPVYSPIDRMFLALNSIVIIDDYSNLYYAYEFSSIATIHNFSSIPFMYSSITVKVTNSYINIEKQYNIDDLENTIIFETSYFGYKLTHNINVNHTPISYPYLNSIQLQYSSDGEWYDINIINFTPIIFEYYLSINSYQQQFRISSLTLDDDTPTITSSILFNNREIYINDVFNLNIGMNSITVSLNGSSDEVQYTLYMTNFSDENRINSLYFTFHNDFRLDLPDFHVNNNNYDISVLHKTNYIDLHYILVEPNSSYGSIPSGNTIPLFHQSNPIELVIMAENNSTNCYLINVTKENMKANGIHFNCSLLHNSIYYYHSGNSILPDFTIHSFTQISLSIDDHPHNPYNKHFIEIGQHMWKYTIQATYDHTLTESYNFIVEGVTPGLLDMNSALAQNIDGIDFTSNCYIFLDYIYFIDQDKNITATTFVENCIQYKVNENYVNSVNTDNLTFGLNSVIIEITNIIPGTLASSSYTLLIERQYPSSDTNITIYITNSTYAGSNILTVESNCTILTTPINIVPSNSYATVNSESIGNVLNSGLNNLPIIVTAQDTNVVKTHYIKVYRKVYTDPVLNSLFINGSEVIIHSNCYIYNHQLYVQYYSYQIDSIDITINDQYSYYMMSESIPWYIGQGVTKTLIITVYDIYDNKNIYTLNIAGGKSNNANLLRLYITTTSNSLIKYFDVIPYKSIHYHSVEEYTEFINIYAIPIDSFASTDITTSPIIILRSGYWNSITINVIAHDNINSKKYTISVYRNPSTDTSIENTVYYYENDTNSYFYPDTSIENTANSDMQIYSPSQEEGDGFFRHTLIKGIQTDNDARIHKVYIVFPSGQVPDYIIIPGFSETTFINKTIHKYNTRRIDQGTQYIDITTGEGITPANKYKNWQIRFINNIIDLKHYHWDCMPEPNCQTVLFEFKTENSISSFNIITKYIHISNFTKQIFTNDTLISKTSSGIYGGSVTNKYYKTQYRATVFDNKIYQRYNNIASDIDIYPITKHKSITIQRNINGILVGDKQYDLKYEDPRSGLFKQKIELSKYKYPANRNNNEYVRMYRYQVAGYFFYAIYVTGIDNYTREIYKIGFESYDSNKFNPLDSDLLDIPNASNTLTFHLGNYYKLRNLTRYILQKYNDNKIMTTNNNEYIITKPSDDDDDVIIIHHGINSRVEIPRYNSSTKLLLSYKLPNSLHDSVSVYTAISGTIVNNFVTVQTSKDDTYYDQKIPSVHYHRVYREYPVFGINKSTSTTMYVQGNTRDNMSIRYCCCLQLCPERGKFPMKVTLTLPEGERIWPLFNKTFVDQTSGVEIETIVNEYIPGRNLPEWTTEFEQSSVTFTHYKYDWLSDRYFNEPGDAGYLSYVNDAQYYDEAQYILDTHYIFNANSRNNYSLFHNCQFAMFTTSCPSKIRVNIQYFCVTNAKTIGQFIEYRLVLDDVVEDPKILVPSGNSVIIPDSPDEINSISINYDTTINVVMFYYIYIDVNYDYFVKTRVYMHIKDDEDGSKLKSYTTGPLEIKGDLVTNTDLPTGQQINGGFIEWEYWNPNRADNTIKTREKWFKYDIPFASGVTISYGPKNVKAKFYDYLNIYNLFGGDTPKYSDEFLTVNTYFEETVSYWNPFRNNYDEIKSSLIIRDNLFPREINPTNIQLTESFDAQLKVKIYIAIINGYYHYTITSMFTPYITPAAYIAYIHLRFVGNTDIYFPSSNFSYAYINNKISSQLDIASNCTTFQSIISDDFRIYQHWMDKYPMIRNSNPTELVPHRFEMELITLVSKKNLYDELKTSNDCISITVASETTNDHVFNKGFNISDTYVPNSYPFFFIEEAWIKKDYTFYGIHLDIKIKEININNYIYTISLVFNPKENDTYINYIRFNLLDEILFLPGVMTSTKCVVNKKWNRSYIVDIVEGLTIPVNSGHRIYPSDDKIEIRGDIYPTHGQLVHLIDIVSNSNIQIPDETTNWKEAIYFRTTKNVTYSTNSDSYSDFDSVIVTNDSIYSDKELKQFEIPLGSSISREFPTWPGPPSQFIVYPTRSVVFPNCPRPPPSQFIVYPTRNIEFPTWSGPLSYGPILRNVEFPEWRGPPIDIDIPIPPTGNMKICVINSPINNYKIWYDWSYYYNYRKIETIELYFVNNTSGVVFPEPGYSSALINNDSTWEINSDSNKVVLTHNCFHSMIGTNCQWVELLEINVPDPDPNMGLIDDNYAMNIILYNESGYTERDKSFKHKVHDLDIQNSIIIFDELPECEINWVISDTTQTLFYKLKSCENISGENMHISSIYLNMIPSNFIDGDNNITFTLGDAFINSTLTNSYIVNSYNSDMISMNCPLSPSNNDWYIQVFNSCIVITQMSWNCMPKETNNGWVKLLEFELPSYLQLDLTQKDSGVLIEIKKGYNSNNYEYSIKDSFRTYSDDDYLIRQAYSYIEIHDPKYIGTQIESDNNKISNSYYQVFINSYILLDEYVYKFSYTMKYARTYFFKIYQIDIESENSYFNGYLNIPANDDCIINRRLEYNFITYGTSMQQMNNYSHTGDDWGIIKKDNIITIACNSWEECMLEPTHTSTLFFELRTNYKIDIKKVNMKFAQLNIFNISLKEGTIIKLPNQIQFCDYASDVNITNNLEDRLISIYNLNSEYNHEIPSHLIQQSNFIMTQILYNIQEYNHANIYKHNYYPIHKADEYVWMRDFVINQHLNNDLLTNSLLERSLYNSIDIYSMNMYSM